jgi:membrane protein
MLERVRELASAPLIPYLVVASALVPRTENESFADTLIERFDLQGRAADGVRALFATAGEVESGITFIGIAILLVTVVSFARALQNPYERSYHLEPSGVAGVPHSLLWIGVLALWLSLVSIRNDMDDWLGPLFAATVSLGFGFAILIEAPRGATA